MATTYKSISIIDIVSETSDVKTFRLRYSDGTSIHYEAGQFITLVFPKHNGEEDRRSYSFSSTPGIDAEAAITLKRIPNGQYSRKLIDEASVGDTLLTVGASGYFTSPEDTSSCDQIFFLAAGSGITPVYSLLRKILRDHAQLPVTLLYSNRSRKDTVFYDELVELQKVYRQLTIEFLQSDAPNLLRARLTKRSLELLLKDYGQASYTRTLFYLCGPFDYMRMATIVLQTEGVPHDNIRKENFALVKPVQRLVPSDQDTHTIELHLQGQPYSFTAQYPETILQRAKKLNISIPYSCESGQCGTCAATCVRGHIWMWNNEVLSDREVAQGRVLTCTGYAVGGDVVLEI